MILYDIIIYGIMILYMILYYDIIMKELTSVNAWKNGIKVSKQENCPYRLCSNTFQI